MFAALVGGGVGGLLSSATAHVITTLFDNAGRSESWLQGPYGPPFFNISLFMGVLYGGIARALSPRKSDVLVGALGPFLGIIAPMAVLERLRDLPWLRVVEGVFVLATWGTMLALGWRLGRGWRGALGAAAGAFGGYLVLTGLTLAAPELAHWPARMHSYLPAPTVLLDGALTGAGLGLGIFIFRRH